jgi:hypothetical protein
MDNKTYIPSELTEFIDMFGHKIEFPHKKENWYYLPYWIMENEDTGSYELVDFEKIPEYLRQFIEDKR